MGPLRATNRNQIAPATLFLACYQEMQQQLTNIWIKHGEQRGLGKDNRPNSKMVAAAEPRACSACARAKRRCGKQMPCCQRCKNKGINCAYPTTKPSSFNLLEQPALVLEDRLSSEATTLPTCTVAACLNDNISTPLTLDLTTPLGHYLAKRNPSIWFLSPEAWEIEHPSVQDASMFCLTDMKRFVADLQRWFEQWIKMGSNPFIHPHLYRSRFPGCVQVAYTTLSGYINRTESNTEIILRIVDDRANELLIDSGVLLDNSNHVNSFTVPEPPNTLEQLARVHALMVYQVIGLFDGDIRSRHHAEARMHTLDSWASQMVDFASRCPHLLDSPLNPVGSTETGLSDLLNLTSDAESLWHSWILTESVRRTWHIAKGLQSLYFLIQQGWSYCPGGMMLTTRQGVWEADTAFAWEKLCSEVDIGFVQRFKAEKLFTEASPAHIDEFGEFMLEITFGPERMKRWSLERNES